MKSIMPPIALDKHIALLGATGSGKTSAAKTAIVEPALSSNERVIILDPTAAWWGIRLAADGKKKGFPIYIFGGDHGDYPLREKDAGLLADAFGTSSDSAIFDMSLMTVSARMRFFTEFAEAIRRKNRGPLKLIIDEAHLFMPQAGAAGGGQVPAMLHAGNNLVALGRSRGLRITLISQRPAKLHKDSLTQVQSLVVMRLLAPQDRKAISAWIADQATETDEADIIASLPSLKPGEGWIWSPLDNVLSREKFPMPITFDSSRAPDLKDGEGPKLAPLDMDRLAERLAAVDKAKKDSDPAALHAIIRQRDATIEEMNRRAPIQAEPSEKEIEKVRAASFLTGISSGRGHIRGVFGDFSREITDLLERTAKEIDRLTDKAFVEATAANKTVNVIVPARKVIDAKTSTDITNAPHVKRLPRAEPPQYTFERQPGTGPSSLPKGEKIVLSAIARPNGITRAHLTVLTGYKKTSRDTYIQRLRQAGHIDQNGDRLIATDEGIAALGSDYEPPLAGEALRTKVLADLPEGERAILTILIQHHPESVSRDALSERTNYKKTSRDTYLQRLAARELINTNRGYATASNDLFD